MLVTADTTLFNLQAIEIADDGVEIYPGTLPEIVKALPCHITKLHLTTSLSSELLQILPKHIIQVVLQSEVGIEAVADLPSTITTVFINAPIPLEVVQAIPLHVETLIAESALSPDLLRLVNNFQTLKRILSKHEISFIKLSATTLSEESLYEIIGMLTENNLTYFPTQHLKVVLEKLGGQESLRDWQQLRNSNLLTPITFKVLRQQPVSCHKKIFFLCETQRIFTFSGQDFSQVANSLRPIRLASYGQNSRMENIDADQQLGEAKNLINNYCPDIIRACQALLNLGRIDLPFFSTIVRNSFRFQYIDIVSLINQLSPSQKTSERIKEILQLINYSVEDTETYLRWLIKPLYSEYATGVNLEEVNRKVGEVTAIVNREQQDYENKNWFYKWCYPNENIDKWRDFLLFSNIEVSTTIQVLTLYQVLMSLKYNISVAHSLVEELCLQLFHHFAIRALYTPPFPFYIGKFIEAVNNSTPTSMKFKVVLGGRDRGNAKDILSKMHKERNFEILYFFVELKQFGLLETLSLTNGIKNSRVKQLCLSYQDLHHYTPIEINQFVASLADTGVEELNIIETPLTGAQLVALTQGLANTSIKKISIVGSDLSHLTPSKMKKFSQNLVGTKVHTLILSKNKLGHSSSDVIDALIEGLENTPIKNLAIIKNNLALLKQEGAIALIKKLDKTNVRIFNLANNQLINLNVEGMYLVVAGLKGTKVHTLDISYNSFEDLSEKGLETFKKILCKNLLGTKVRNINLKGNGLESELLREVERVLQVNYQRVLSGKCVLSGKSLVDLSAYHFFKNNLTNPARSSILLPKELVERGEKLAAKCGLSC